MSDNEEILESSSQNELSDELPEQDPGWVLLILSLPYIGGILTTVLALVPAALLFIAVGAVLDIESETVSNWVLFFALPITWFWLRYLEKRAGVAVCLSIPVLNIPIKWLLLPLAVIWGYLLITGQTV